MTQIIVTIEDISVATQLLAVIQKLKGVTQAAFYQSETLPEKKRLL